MNVTVAATASTPRHRLPVVEAVIKLWRRMGAEYQYRNVVAGRQSDWLPRDADPLDDELARLSVEDSES
jgi:hypothetical protein